MALDRSLRRSRILARFGSSSTDQPGTPGNLVSALSVLDKMQSQPQHFQFAVRFLHRLLWPLTVPHLMQRPIFGCIFRNCCVVSCAGLSLKWHFDYQDHFRNSWSADCQSDVSAPTCPDSASDSHMSGEPSNHFVHSPVQLFLLLESRSPSQGLSNSWTFFRGHPLRLNAAEQTYQSMLELRSLGSTTWDDARFWPRRRFQRSCLDCVNLRLWLSFCQYFRLWPSKFDQCLLHLGLKSSKYSCQSHRCLEASTLVDSWCLSSNMVRVSNRWDDQSELARWWWSPSLPSICSYPLYTSMPAMSVCQQVHSSKSFCEHATSSSCLVLLLWE